MLTIAPETLAFIIEKARELDAEIAPIDDDPGASQAEDAGVAVLEATADDPIRAELTEAIAGLNTDAQEELLALLWVGRGDFGRAEWADALRLARQRRNARETDYLVGTPLLADYLEQALDEIGVTIDDADR